jgi:hypothetical protein
MVLQYWGVSVSLQDVLKKIGYPPINFNRLENAVESYGLTFNDYPNSNIDQLKHWIDRGVPVIVQQVFSETDLTGHDRVVIGYDDARRLIIVNDGVLGPFYTISYDRFALLWKDLVKYVYPQNPLNESYIITPVGSWSKTLITYPPVTTSSATDFSLSLSPNSLLVNSNESAAFNLIVTVSGTGGAIQLTAQNLPSYFKLINMPTMTGGSTGASQSFTVTLAAGSQIPLGKYSLTLTGVSGNFTHSAILTIIVGSISSTTTQSTSQEQQSATVSLIGAFPTDLGVALAVALIVGSIGYGVLKKRRKN